MLRGGMSRVVVGGVDLTERYGVLYTDESVRNPPEKRTNYVELPAMDGVLDVSEVWTDDVVFGLRQETIVLYVPPDKDFERVKTDISNFLDGRRLDYSYSFDPGYTLTGRFRVTDYSGWRDQRIEIEVDADPWKRGEHRHYDVQGAGGTMVTVENSRRHVGPAFTVPQACLIEYGGRAWEIPGPGSWRLDMRLKEGISQIYVNSAPTMCDTTVNQFVSLMKDCKLSALPKKRISEFYYTSTSAPKGTAYRVQIDYDLYDL